MDDLGSAPVFKLFAFMSFESFVEILSFARHLLYKTKTVNEVVKAARLPTFMCLDLEFNSKLGADWDWNSSG